MNLLQLDPSVFIIAGIAAGLIFLGSMAFIASRYRRCPHGKALVVFGKIEGKQDVRCFLDGRIFVWPVFQDHAFLSLDPITASLQQNDVIRHKQLQGVPSGDFTVAIGRDHKMLDAAARNLLGLSTEQIGLKAREIVLRGITAHAESADTGESDHQASALTRGVQEGIEAELRTLGLSLVALNVPELAADTPG